MMRRAAFVFVILLLGLGAWWLASMTSAAGALPEPANEPAAPTVHASAGVDESAVQVGHRDELQRSAVETTEVPTGPDADMVNVRVVDATTLQPEPAAEVVWYDNSFDWSQLTEADRELQSRDLEQLLRSRANTTIADPQGRVVLPKRLWVSMRAVSGNRHASGVWRPDVALEIAPPYAGEFLLRLETDRTLLVRAVDAQGTPVGDVIVQLERTHQLVSGGTARSRQNLPPTGPDGITQLRHAQESFAATDRIVAAELRARLSGADGEPAVIDPGALPADPIDVVLPAFGSVLVQLLGPDGEPWPFPESSRGFVLLVAPDWKGGAVEDGINSERLDMQGRVTFAHVRCDLRFEVRGPTGWNKGSVFAGPERQGQQVQMALRMPADAILVTGRVLHEDRTPFAGAIVVRGENQRGSSQRALSPDAEGRFCVPIREFLAGVRSLTLQQRDKDGTMRLESTITLRTPLAPGRNDLGDVVLAEAPLLVAGWVTFADGDDPTGVLDRLQLEIESCEAGDRPRWRQVYVGVRLDTEHRFAIRGNVPGDRFRIVVNGECVPLAPREFSPGTGDLHIEIAHGGTVTATFVPDPLLAWLTHRLVPDPAPPTEYDGSRDRRETGQPKRRDGQLVEVHWNGLQAGNHRLLVGYQGEDPLLDLLVQVPVAGAADDPRLLDIDLRGRMRGIRVKLTDAAGMRFPGTATIVLRGRLDDAADWHGQEFDANSGEGEFFVVSRPVDLFVVAPGHRGAVVPSVFADTTVALSPAPKVTLQWVDAPSLPDGVTASVLWAPADWPTRGPSLRVWRGGGSQSGPASRLLSGQIRSAEIQGGRATLIAEAPFPLQLRLHLRKKGKPTQLVALQPVVIDPAQLTDGQTIDLRTNPTAVAQALQTLGGR